jgi:hypothetical protein
MQGRHLAWKSAEKLPDDRRNCEGQAKVKSAPKEKGNYLAGREALSNVQGNVN